VFGLGRRETGGLLLFKGDHCYTVLSNQEYKPLICYKKQPQIRMASCTTL